MTLSRFARSESEFPSSEDSFERTLTPPGSGNADELIAWVLNDARLSKLCATAVDPMEVAARLETFGLSARVVRSKFGFPEVFTAAQVVFDAIPFEDQLPDVRQEARMGRPFDLLRGALYAIPAVFFSLVIITFRLSTHWWLLPAGLTVSWGTTQAFTVLGWSLRDRDDHRSDALLATSVIVATALACLLAAVVLAASLGGTLACVVVTVSLGAYIAASSVLVFHEAEQLLLICLVPALLGSSLALGVISTHVAIWFIVASGALVVAAAVGSTSTQHWQAPRFSVSTWKRSGKFLAYGLGCGLMTSAVIGFATRGTQASGSVEIAAGPLLVTLGLMEWQIRSLRCRIQQALQTSPDVVRFGHRSRNAVARSITTYVSTLLATSVVALLIAWLRHLANPTLLITTIDIIGVCFFLALILIGAGLVNRVLVAWSAALIAFVSSVSLLRALTGHLTPDDGVVAVLGSAAVAIVALSVLARGALTSPLTYVSSS